MIVERYPPRSSGGASNYAKRCADALARNGHRVTVITTIPYSGFRSLNPSIRMDGNVKVIEVCPLNLYDAYKADDIPSLCKPLFYLSNMWNAQHYFTLRRIFKTEEPDIAHFHGFDGFSFSVVDAARVLGIPRIITLHAFGLLCPRVVLLHENGRTCRKANPACQILRSLRRIVLEDRFNVVLAPSQFALDVLSENGFLQSSEKVKIPLFIDMKEFRGSRKAEDKSRESFEVLYVGRLSRHKGVHILITAFKGLPFPDASLHIIGWGDFENSLRETSKGDDRIHFHGKMPLDMLADQYANADVTVVPSICFENSPYAVYESFCMGTPVVGSRIGGIPELIEDGHNGLLSEAGSVEELRTNLRGLIEDKEKLKNLKEGAKESASKYDISSHIHKLEEIYVRAIESSKGENS